MTRDVWHDALRPDISGIAVDALLFHEAGSQLVHRYRVYKDPFPHLAHLRISIPSSGAPAGRVPMECFPLATAPVSQARRRVSFADEVTTLNEEEINMRNADESPEVPPVSQPLTPPVVMEEAAIISKTGPTPLIMLVVERIEYDSPAAEPVELQTITPESGVLPPPGFPPFLFPENDGGMDADDIYARFGGLASLTFAQIGRESPDIPDETDVPEAGVSRRPSLDSSSEAIPMVGYAHMPLPSWTIVLCQNWCGCLLFLDRQYGRWIEKLQYLGGGWPGRVRSSRKDRRSLSVRWGLGVPSGTPHTMFQTMQSRRESTDFS